MQEEKKKEVENKPKVQAPPAPVQPKITVLSELRQSVILLERALYTADLRSAHRITKAVKRFQQCMKPHFLKKLWSVFFPAEIAIPWQEFPDFDATYDEPFQFTQTASNQIIQYIQIEVYFYIIFLIYLVRIQKYYRARQIVSYLLGLAKDTNQRSFDYLNSYVYYYHSLLKEKELATRKNSLLEIRDELLLAYRNSCLRHDEIGQATLLNLLLRNYLHYNHYEAASHLIDKCTFPEGKSNNEFVRYLYYIGKISAIKLQYSDSLNSLNQALRRAPDNTALGFRIQAQQLAIVVELLLGDIPNRDIFAQKELEKDLIPYYKLVQSVFQGNLLDFKNTLNQYESKYIEDRLYTLIQRLHLVVLKTGLRKINSSYSQISFQDIATQLNLPSGTDVQFIVAKAIRDGILTGTINHENQYVQIDEKQEFYSTSDPQASLLKRIDFCINLQQRAIKSLQFPNSEYETAQFKEDPDADGEILGMLEDEF